MNLIILFPSDLRQNNIAEITDARRFEHITQIQKASLGDTLKIGLLDGEMGTGLITDINSHSIRLELTLDQAPPPASHIRVILGLPRPPC